MAFIAFLATVFIALLVFFCFTGFDGSSLERILGNLTGENCFAAGFFLGESGAFFSSAPHRRAASRHKALFGEYSPTSSSHVLARLLDPTPS